MRVYRVTKITPIYQGGAERRLEADWRAGGADAPQPSPSARAARAPYAGLGTPAWLAAWSEARDGDRAGGRGPAASLALWAVRPPGWLVRGPVAWSRPSTPAENRCRPSHDVDGPRDAAPSTSAR